MVYIAELTTDIRGETNFVANTLSQPSVSAIGSASVINYKELSEDQALDAECMRLRHSTSSTFDFQLPQSFDNILAWCDVSTGHARPYVMVKFQRKIFRAFMG